MLRTPLATTLAVAAIATSASAQIAWPDDSPLTSQGNIVPLGYLQSNDRFDEGRYQILIPARYLPSTGASIQGLSVAQPSGPTSVTYASLQITMSLTSATQLSTTFANNLPQPVVVYNATDTTEQFVTRDWSPSIAFQQPFFYDGQSDLVIEIQKVLDRNRFPPTAGVATHATNGNTDRRDLPNAVYAFSSPNGGGATATTATTSATPLKVRLDIAPFSTLSVRSDRGGANNKIFAIGAPFSIQFRGTPGDSFAHVIAFGFLPGPASVPPIQGGVWIDLSLSAVAGSGVLGTSGEDITTLSLPNDPGLVGGLLTFQGVWQNSAGVLSWTNATDAFIND